MMATGTLPSLGRGVMIYNRFIPTAVKKTCITSPKRLRGASVVLNKICCLPRASRTRRPNSKSNRFSDRCIFFFVLEFI